MKKLGTILMGMMLAVTLVFGVMPQQVVKAEEPIYPVEKLMIAGTEVTDEVTSGDGWNYDAATNTVTLTGDIDAGDNPVISQEHVNKTLYVKAEKDVTLKTSGDRAIYCDYSLDTSIVIMGSGKITIQLTSSSNAINAICGNHTIEIADNASVAINMPEYKEKNIGMTGLLTPGGFVKIKGNVAINFAKAAPTCDWSSGFSAPMGTIGVYSALDLDGGTLKVTGANVGVAGEFNVTGENANIDIMAVNAGVCGDLTMTAGTANIKATAADGVALTGSKVVASGAKLTLSPNPDAASDSGSGDAGSSSGSGTDSGASDSGSSSAGSSSGSNSTTSSSAAASASATTPVTSTTETVQKPDGTTETITTTTVSDTEKVITSSTGTEQRKINTKTNTGYVVPDVTVEGKSTAIPTGAVFDCRTYEKTSPNYAIVQTAIQASSNEELKKADKVEAIEFNLSESNGTAIHQLGDYVQVSYPLSYYYNDNAATVPAGKQIVVYRVEDDGTLTRCETSISNGMITFLTNHFSTYIIAEEAIVTTSPKTGEIPMAGILMIVVVLAGVSGMLFVSRRKNSFK